MHLRVCRLIGLSLQAVCVVIPRRGFSICPVKSHASCRCDPDRDPPSHTRLQRLGLHANSLRAHCSSILFVHGEEIPRQMATVKVQR